MSRVCKSLKFEGLHGQKITSRTRTMIRNGMYNCWLALAAMLFMYSNKWINIDVRKRNRFI